MKGMSYMANNFFIENTTYGHQNAKLKAEGLIAVIHHSPWDEADDNNIPGNYLHNSKLRPSFTNLYLSTLQSLPPAIKC